MGGDAGVLSLTGIWNQVPMHMLELACRKYVQGSRYMHLVQTQGCQAYQHVPRQTAKCMHRQTDAYAARLMQVPMFCLPDCTCACISAFLACMPGHPACPACPILLHTALDNLPCLLPV